MLINKKHVRQLALDLSKLENNGRNRVGSTFFDAVEAAVREAVTRRVTHHDNKTGRRRTLV